MFCGVCKSKETQATILSVGRRKPAELSALGRCTLLYCLWRMLLLRPWASISLLKRYHPPLPQTMKLQKLTILGELFGNSAPANTVDGGQAEYVRCPLADSTFVIAPKNIPEEMLVLMADIFPTGYFAASRYLKNLSDRDRKEFTVVCVGCGPVGICAITAALTMVDKVYVVDSVPERLEEAKRIGAIPIHLNDDPVAKIKAASDGRGADVVMEVVGHADAFHLAFDMIRPWGQISSIGVHTEPINMNGLMMYGKNVSMAFGRCPVRSIFEEALEVLVKEQKKVAFLCGKTMSLEDAPKAYEDFEQRKVTKIVFKMDEREAGQDVSQKVAA